MKPLALSTICQWSGGVLKTGHGERVVVRVCTDSRKVKPGDLFVALKGPNFDGHGFLDEVAGKGAIAAMVDSDQADCGGKLALIHVKDVLEGLQKLAAEYRSSFPVKIVGVTGSNGKTSTKELIAAVLGERFRVSKTEGNLNNHIGVPLSLLSLNEDDEYGVIEMGMNHPGEIAALSALAKPDIGVITSVGWAHVEAFGDRKAIAEEKGALIRALPAGGLAILNGNAEQAGMMGSWTEARAVTVGAPESCTYRLEDCVFEERWARFRLTGEGRSESLRISFPGWHMVQNACLAAALGFELGMESAEISGGLERCGLPGGRTRVAEWGGGWLIDDTYNANPDSMGAGFKTLNVLCGDGRKVALLGSMGELGGRSEALHEMVGKDAAQRGIEMLFALGEFAEAMVRGAKEAGLNGDSARVFSSHEEMTGAYLKEARKGDCVLIKGSRSERMEKVVEGIQSAGGEAAG